MCRFCRHLRGRGCAPPVPCPLDLFLLGVALSYLSEFPLLYKAEYPLPILSMLVKVTTKLSRLHQERAS